MAINLVRKLKYVRRLNRTEKKRLFLQSIKSLTIPRPNLVAIEATSNCNARCIFCDINWQKAKIPSGYMKEEVFEKILPFLTKETNVVFSSSGECFLHRDYGKMLKKLKERAKDVVAITNGQTLNESLITELVEYGLDELRVSIHAASESTYQNIYHAGSLSEVIDNLNLLNYIKTKNKTELPILGINVIAMRKNIEEIPEIVELAGRLKANDVRIIHLIVANEAIRNQSLFFHKELATVNFEKTKEIAKKLELTVSLPSFLETKTDCCMNFFNHLYITWDGLVLSCCMERHYYGNLKKESLERIWNGRRIRQFRKTYYQKGIEMVCPRCPVWDKTQEAFVNFYYPKESVRFCHTGID